MHEGIPILNFLVPKAFTARRRQADRRDASRRSRAVRDAKGRRQLVPDRRARRRTSSATTCWSRSARRTRSRGSSATSASSSTSGACRCVDKVTLPVDACRDVFFGGDAAFGPKNIIWAVAHGHDAAISIDKLLPRRGHAASARRRTSTSMSQKMGIHEWSYDNAITPRPALQGAAEGQVDRADEHQGRGRARLRRRRSRSRKRSAASTATCRRCSATSLCIECDACVDICPMDCITFTANGDEADLRPRLQRAGAQPRRRTSTCRAR